MEENSPAHRSADTAGVMGVITWAVVRAALIIVGVKKFTTQKPKTTKM